MHSGSTTCCSAFISISQSQSLSFLLLLLLMQQQWQDCDWVCAKYVCLNAYMLSCRQYYRRPGVCMTCFNQCLRTHSSKCSSPGTSSSRALSLSLSLSSVPTCADSIMLYSLGTVPAFSTHGQHLFTVWSPHPEKSTAESSAEKRRWRDWDSQVGGKTDSAVCQSNTNPSGLVQGRKWV